MKRLLQLILVFAIFSYYSFAGWQSSGVGGGGALFSPSINPNNDNEYYISCDMSQMFHTLDFGETYEMLHFRKLIAGSNSQVCFTNDNNVRYTIDKTREISVPVKSTDAGATWSALPGNPYPFDEVYSIKSNIHDKNTIVISFWSEIHISFDAGVSFSKIFTATDNGVGAILAGVFFDSDKIFVATNEGLLVSTNAGKSFVLENYQGIPSPQKVWSFSAAKQNGVIRFLCLTGQNMWNGMTGSDYYGFVKGIYVKNYSDTKWTAKQTGINLATDYVMWTGMAENDINTMYLCGSTSTSVPNVLKSTNGGDSWTRVFNSYANANIKTGWSGANGDRDWTYGECAFGFAVAPLNSQKLIFTDYGFAHVSSDAGAHWKQAYTNKQYENPEGKYIIPGKEYKSCGLENTTCWQVEWFDKANIFACFSDIKGVISSDAGNTWSFNYGGHSANTMYRIAKTPDNKMFYAATSNIHDLYQSTRLTDAILDAKDAQGKILYSSNNGVSWNEMHNFYHPVFWVALDPKKPNLMYASVVHSTEGGIYFTNTLSMGPTSVWTKFPNPPRTEGHPATINVLDDGRVVATYSGRRTTNFTASSGVFIFDPVKNSWTDVSNNNMKYWTKDLVIDPNDPLQKTWYVGVFSGWGGAANGLGGLYKTTNAGASWAKINDQDRVSSITFNPMSPNEIFMTTETQGLWKSSNINSPKPEFTQVMEYKFRQPERVFFNPYIKGEMWVTSFGAGMTVFSIDNPDKLPTPTIIEPKDDKEYRIGVDIWELPPFKWTSIDEAITYNIEVYYDTLNATFYTQQGMKDTTCRAQIKNQGYYTWRIKALNNTKESAWSEFARFKINKIKYVGDEILSEISIWPNPCSDIFTITSSNGFEDFTRIEIFDQIGRSVGLPILNKDIIGKTSIDLSASELALIPGVYFVKLSGTKNTQTFKLSVSK